MIGNLVAGRYYRLSAGPVRRDEEKDIGGAEGDGRGARCRKDRLVAAGVRSDELAGRSNGARRSRGNIPRLRRARETLMRTQ